MRHLERLTTIALVLIAACAGAMISLAYEREPPPLAHYTSEFPPRIGFVLDRTSELPKLRFDGTEEILVLSMRYAAGNLRQLVRDDGEVVLNISGLGGVTLFTPANRGGIPVGPDGTRVAPLVSPAPPIGSIRGIAGVIMAQLKRDTGRDVVFEANWDQAAPNAIARSVLHDAIRNTGTALLLLSRTPYGRAAIVNNLARVRFVQGGYSTTYFQGNMMIVEFSVGRGMAGRPSSFAIQRGLRQIIR